jgi:hypothetical protein
MAKVLQGNVGETRRETVTTEVTKTEGGKSVKRQQACFVFPDAPAGAPQNQHRRDDTISTRKAQYAHQPVLPDSDNIYVGFEASQLSL